MSVARIRVEAKNYNPNASGDDKERNFKGLFTAFKKQCSDAGVMREYKKHETYEKPGEKKRRKKRESEIALLKAKFRENFTEKRKTKDFYE